MDHVAIMKKSWGLTEKILTREKSIESRWYKTKHAPWGNITKNDVIYFKNSGEPITIKAAIDKVISYSDLTPQTIEQILNQYGSADGIKKDEIKKYSHLFKDKKYCLLLFLKHPIRIKPFDIDKTGFGAMAAWISIKNIDQIRMKS